MLKLPFDRQLFDRAFWFACGLALFGWFAIYLIWGEFTAADIVGMIVATPILAYLIHVLMLFNQLSE